LLGQAQEISRLPLALQNGAEYGVLCVRWGKIEGMMPPRVVKKGWRLHLGPVHRWLHHGELSVMPARAVATTHLPPCVAQQCLHHPHQEKKLIQLEDAWGKEDRGRNEGGHRCLTDSCTVRMGWRSALKRLKRRHHVLHLHLHPSCR
jgi:hypothetical protein